ncbi:MAG: TIGR01459 family HAD-type hydrolase [Granulosicoccus sp.]
MSDSHPIVTLTSISDLVNDFDGFIVDQFGVLHDGQHPYPDAVNALQALMNANKRVIILSNSGKRSSINIQRMSRLGFARNLYSEFVTSGDVAYEKVKSQFADKRRCLLIARDGDVSAIDGLQLELTDAPGKADLLIISASEGDRYSEQHYIDLLESAARQKLPCLCTNPDKLMLTQNGIRFGAGRIAELYEQSGGTVQWIGKPYKDVYEHALRHLPGIPKERILCIGDSLEHDIAGGVNAGLKTLFIRGGIHQDMDNSQLAHAMQRYQVCPEFELSMLR